MTELFNVAVVALLLIAPRHWCDANENETANHTEQPPRVDPDSATNNPFYEFFACNPTFWVTQGNATPGYCSWFKPYNLTNAEVKFEYGTKSKWETDCRELYISYNFGANDTMFSLSMDLDVGVFERMRYKSVNCVVTEDVGWSQQKDNKSESCKREKGTENEKECELPECEFRDDQLDPFVSQPCCYTNDTQRINNSSLLRRLRNVSEPYYCSREPSYTIYLRSQESVPSDCLQAYVNLTSPKQG
uniref:Lipocalin n=1 Tax=Rhipicephalus zambeziensis TaxID=60191 RepID=A0A224YDX4_9ACAR